VSAVAAEPETLAELSWRLRDQADSHVALRAALGRSIDATPLTAGTIAALVAETATAARDLGELAQSFDDLARFVRDVSEALTAADSTLAAVNDGWLKAGSSPWTQLSSGNTSSHTWTYSRGTRRIYTGEMSGPLDRAGRTRNITVGNGSVQDGWTSKSTELSLVNVMHSSLLGAGATRHFGRDAAYVELHAHAGLGTTVHANAGVSNREAHLTVGGRVEFGAAVSATAGVGNAALGAGVAGRVFAGAAVEGEATVKVGLDGITAEVEGRVLVGAEAEVEGELSVLGVVARPHAAVSVGFGLQYQAEADLGLDKISFKVDLGATIGLGVNVGVDVSINPRAVAGGAVDAIEGGASSAKKGIKKLKGLFS
jgi:hypothetical protein